MSRNVSTIETHPTGTFFDFDDPRPEMIHIEDIARALSEQCRFGGHVRMFCSIAEHALLVHRLVRNVAGPELAFAALHHDSHEAYLGDVITPLKQKIKAAAPEMWAALESSTDSAIATRFGLDPSLFHHDIIKAADEQALWIEASVLKVSRGIGAQWGHARTEVPERPTGAVACHEPQWCEALFLSAHRDALAALLNERETA